jgi:hypothetical protein
VRNLASRQHCGASSQQTDRSGESFVLHVGCLTPDVDTLLRITAHDSSARTDVRLTGRRANCPVPWANSCFPSTFLNCELLPGGQRVTRFGHPVHHHSFAARPAPSFANVTPVLPRQADVHDAVPVRSRQVVPNLRDRGEQ